MKKTNTMQSSKVINKIYNKKNQRVEYHILGLEDSEFFDTILSFLKKSYAIEVQSFSDGIITRKYELLYKDECFTLEHHGDIGNYFYGIEGSKILKNIANDLEEKLKGIPYK